MSHLPQESFHITLMVPLLQRSAIFPLNKNWIASIRSIRFHRGVLIEKGALTEGVRYVLINFDSPPYMYNKIFLKKLLFKFVDHVFTLLLTPFASKLVNYSRRSESLIIHENSKLATFSFENSGLSMFKASSNAHCASNNWPIRTQKVPKEA